MKLHFSDLRYIIAEVVSEGIFGPNWEDEAARIDVNPKLNTVGDLRKISKALESEKRGKAGVDTLKDIFKGLGADMFPMGGTILSSIEGLKKMYGAPDDKKTDTALDRLNIDDEVAAIVDDTVEDNFLKDVVNQVSDLSDDDPIPDMDELLAKWLKQKYDNRSVTLPEAKMMKVTKKQLRRIIKEEKAEVLAKQKVRSAVRTVLKEFRKTFSSGDAGMEDPDDDDSEMLWDVVYVIEMGEREVDRWKITNKKTREEEEDDGIVTLKKRHKKAIQDDERVLAAAIKSVLDDYSKF